MPNVKFWRFIFFFQYFKNIQELNLYIYIRNCFWRLWYSQQKSVKIITPLKFTSNMVMRDDAMSIFAHAILIPQVKIEGQPTPMD